MRVSGPLSMVIAHAVALSTDSSQVDADNPAALAAPSSEAKDPNKPKKAKKE